MVERAATDEPQSWASVLGVDRHLTGWTSEDPLRAAVVGRCLDRLLVSANSCTRSVSIRRLMTRLGLGVGNDTLRAGPNVTPGWGY